MALNAQVGAHGGDPVVIAQGRAGLPAVANLLVLVDQREVFALVGVRLDTADLVRPFGSWSRRSALSAADSGPLLEPPGFLMRNYGHGTPIATLLAHIAYGAIVGGFVSVAG